MDANHLSRAFPHVVAGLSQADTAALIAACRVRALIPGDVLIEEGKPSDAVYFLADGHLGVTIAVGRERVVVGRVGPGATLGEISFVDHGPATATLTAQGPATIIEVTGKTLDGLLVDHPAAAGAIQRAVCEALATHLRDATEGLAGLSSGVGSSMPSGERHEGVVSALRGLLGLGRA